MSLVLDTSSTTREEATLVPCPHPGPGGDPGTPSATQHYHEHGDNAGRDSCDLDTSLPSPGYVPVADFAAEADSLGGGLSMEEERQDQGEDVTEDEVINFYSGKNNTFPK